MVVRKNWAQKFKDFIDSNPLTILVVLSVFFISSFITISQGIKQGYDYYNKIFNWKQIEYYKINTIQAGMSLDKFNETFGVPLYSRISESGYKEYIYRRRGYWIQAIASSSGEVAFYSVTACDNNFKPNIDANPIHSKITLGESTFKSVSESSGGLPDQALYYFRFATANSQWYDSYYFGNPSEYKTVFVGINDACREPEVGIDGDQFEYSIKDFQNPEVQKFREKAVINSYGETAPFFDASVVLKIRTYPFNDDKVKLNGFQFGVDRIQIRTLK